MYATKSDSQVHLHIHGKVAFEDYATFRALYLNHTSANLTFIVDLTKCTEMTTSGLGMLLLLKDHVDRINGKVSMIPSESEQVNNLLVLSRLTKLFGIHKDVSPPVVEEREFSFDF